MSLFSWFTRKSKPQAPRQRQAHTMPAPLAANGAGSAAPGRNGNGKPLLEPSASQDPAAARKNERAERRELLYTTVRDAMVRAGVLSAGYKFKVLSLDQRGAQFLVMMDLAQEYSSDMVRLGEIEALITQSAKSRFGIVVPAVYWRINDQIMVGVSMGPAASAARPQASRVPEFTAPAAQASPTLSPPRPAAARQHGVPPASRPAPLVPPIAPAAPPRAATGFEPIEADEVAAFKQALVHAAAARAPAPAAEPGTATRSGPLLPKSTGSTGFEDTVMPTQDAPSSDLSSTQYGDLR
ncbi:hypothetical protein HF896_22390 [Alicycliphilus denitrificans]|uniref:Uncharacterized protein n=1 Tax=Alicycliphilus denitrificans TaxID=179636 RepID=A0A858ZZU0_9BURK|nr:hypothetical protein [Alicycliphilus denitrificans]ADV02099.1 hypothetical protein Alide_4401 [Alicycliphilus denitrificans BC]QKD46193.1 hypothetical protein HF896_22390 [Alicycliphilus denitrificans]GAO21097.1 hypothetical protein ALISP_0917 [Alicycliphilus sp. B1]GAO25697.1 hypothetical protein ALISP_5517 [Alicycliphilus sp. B1]